MNTKTIRIHHEDGNEYSVAADIARHLIQQGRARQVPSEVPAGVLDEGQSTGQGDPRPVTDTMTVDELKAYAAERSIDLGDATKKADILTTIQAAGKPL